MIIQQALHGYESGHRLLASSRRIPTATQRLMLPLSDAVDGRVLNQFDGYLTGYPAPELKAYAIARTWSAPEMARPGCVWTHTLLVSFSDLAALTDPESLLRLFRRPKGDIRGYERPVEFEETSTSLPDASADRERMLRELEAFISSFYTHDRSVALVTETKRDERVVLAIWRQQWPRLRRIFTFCTAGTPTRTIGERPLDLQFFAVGLHNVSPSVLRRVAVIDALDYDRNVPSWARLAAEDALHREGTPLRRYLWHYGAETPSPRDAFVPLLRVYQDIQKVPRDPSVYEDLVRTMSAFGGPSEMRRLKSYVFAPPPAGDVAREAGILEALAADGGDEIDPDSLHIRERAQQLAERDQARAADLAAVAAGTIPRSSLRQAVLEGIALGASRDLLEHLRVRDPASISSLVELRPDLASSPELWDDEQLAEELFTAVNARGVPQRTTKRGLMPSLIRSTVMHLPELVTKGWGPGTYELVLDALGSIESGARLGAGWIEMLARDSQRLIDWLLRTRSPIDANLLAVAARSLDPLDPRVAAVGAEKWLPLARTSAVSEGLDLASASFLLVVGLTSEDRTGTELVVASFAVIHQAVGTGALSEDLWQRIRPALPAPRAEADWDKCDQLRRAVVKTMLRAGSENVLLEIAPRNPLFRQLIETAMSTKKGKKAVLRLRARVGSGEVPATSAQTKVLGEISEDE